LFFRANDGTFGYELWKSDGTQLGTGMADLNKGPSQSLPHTFARLPRHVIFTAEDARGFELWRVKL
jgi:ELWxxDGT repeat protein